MSWIIAPNGTVVEQECAMELGLALPAGWVTVNVKTFEEAFEIAAEMWGWSTTESPAQSS